MKKAKSWLALPLAVCMFAVMIFSVAEAAETSDENPAEGRQEITIINTNHITWPVIGEMPSYELEVPAGAHYFINMVLFSLLYCNSLFLSIFSLYYLFFHILSDYLPLKKPPHIMRRLFLFILLLEFLSLPHPQKFRFLLHRSLQMLFLLLRYLQLFHSQAD